MLKHYSGFCLWYWNHFHLHFKQSRRKCDCLHKSLNLHNCSDVGRCLLLDNNIFEINAQMKDEVVTLLKTHTNEFWTMSDKNKETMVSFLVSQFIIYKRTCLGHKFVWERNSHFKNWNMERCLQMSLKIFELENFDLGIIFPLHWEHLHSPTTARGLEQTTSKFQVLQLLLLLFVSNTAN